MAKNRKTSSSGTQASQETIEALNSHISSWVMGFNDFIDEEMSEDEIKYVKDHMKPLSEINPTGIFRGESTIRTFNQNQLEEGKTFSFEDTFKAFSKDENIAKVNALESLITRGDTTIYKINNGRAFELPNYDDEQEVWVNTENWKVDKITETTAEAMGFRDMNLPPNVYKNIKDKTVRFVEISPT